MPDDTISVFVSYSHDSPQHEARVLALADRLRADGIDAMIDQYQTAPPEGWQLWMEKQIRDADFVLLVCTETYLRRVMKEDAGKGLGVMWESSIIYSYLYNAGVVNEKFIPIVFDRADTKHIPIPLQPTTYYVLSDDAGYESLYRRLTNQPETPAAPLGTRRVLPPLPRLTTQLSKEPSINRTHISQLLSKVQSRSIPLSQCLVEALTLAQEANDHTFEEFCRDELSGYASKKPPFLPYRYIDTFVSVGQGIDLQYFGWGQSASNIFNYMRQNPNDFHPMKLWLNQSVSELESRQSGPKKIILSVELGASDIDPKAKNLDQVPVMAYARADTYAIILEAVRRELTRHLVAILSPTNNQT